MILLLGAPQNEHYAYVFEKITKKGEKVFFLEPWKFPFDVLISFNSLDFMKGQIKTVDSKGYINLSDIKSVYCRYMTEIVNKKNINIEEEFLKEAAYNEIKSALGSFCRGLECLWVDSFEAFEMHLYKSYQYKILHKAGIKVPDTIITNDPLMVQKFWEKHNKQAVFKPCWYGAYTSKLKDDDLNQERLELLKKSPVCFQQYIPGTDILAYVVKDSIFASEVITDAVDFRTAKTVQYKPVKLPDEVEADCVKLMEVLKLNFSVIDIRCTPEKEYFFLEGNPSPVFIHFEKATGYPVGEKLVDLLISGK